MKLITVTAISLTRIVAITTICTIFTIPGSAQSLSDVLDVVVPLKADRRTVEKLLGTPVQEDWKTQYKTDELVVNVVFSPGKCEKIPTFGDRLDIEKDIVV